MAKTVNIHNVPVRLHRRLKSRAARAGMSLSDYLLNEFQQIAELPTPEQMRRRLRNLPRTTPSISAADAVRAERDSG